MNRANPGMHLFGLRVFEGDSTQMPALAREKPDMSTAERYQSLIRIANSIRAQKEPGELFGILVHELSQVVQFDGVAQFDESSNKINWHLGGGCHRPAHSPSEIDR